MSDHTYNIIIKLLTFITVIAFCVAKVMHWIDASWWALLIPILVACIFLVGDNNDDMNKDNTNGRNVAI